VVGNGENRGIIRGELSTHTILIIKKNNQSLFNFNLKIMVFE